MRLMYESVGLNWSVGRSAPRILISLEPLWYCCTWPSSCAVTAMDATDACVDMRVGRQAHDVAARVEVVGQVALMPRRGWRSARSWRRVAAPSAGRQSAAVGHAAHFLKVLCRNNCNAQRNEQCWDKDIPEIDGSIQNIGRFSYLLLWYCSSRWAWRTSPTPRRSFSFCQR